MEVQIPFSHVAGKRLALRYTHSWDTCHFDWFDLCTSARECVETFVSTRDCLELLASTGNCLELLASKGDCVFFDKRFCDFKGRLKIPACLIWQIIQGPSLCIWNILILKCIEVHPVSFD